MMTTVTAPEATKKIPAAIEKQLGDYRGQMTYSCYTKGYDNHNYQCLTTGRATKHATQVAAPVMKEFDYQGNHYQHKVDFDFYGSPDSKMMAAFFHGGPGSGMAPKHRNYWCAKQPLPELKQYDPGIMDYASSYLLFQQPGGKFVYDTESCEPDANLQHLNTTLLIDSLAVAHSALQRHGVQNKKMAVTGLSFGATLSVLFAEKYPEKTEGLALYGLFHGTARDIAWNFQGAHEAYSSEFAESFKKFARQHGGEKENFVNSFSHLLTKFSFSRQHGGEKENFVNSFSHLLKHPDQQVQSEALFHFYRMELYTEEKEVLTTEAFDKWKNPIGPGEYDQKRLRANTMIHFAENNFWLDPKDGIKPAIEKIAKTDTPVVLGLSGNDFLLPPEKRGFMHVAETFSCLKPENFSLVHDGDTAHLSTRQIVTGNHNLRLRMMTKNGIHQRFNV